MHKFPKPALVNVHDLTLGDMGAECMPHTLKRQQHHNSFIAYGGEVRTVHL